MDSWMVYITFCNWGFGGYCLRAVKLESVVGKVDMQLHTAASKSPCNPAVYTMLARDYSEAVLGFESFQNVMCDTNASEVVPMGSAKAATKRPKVAAGGGRMPGTGAVAGAGAGAGAEAGSGTGAVAAAGWGSVAGASVGLQGNLL